ncbi:metal ABC transporter solute-binding protein, Zn/Mn family [Facklamia miroungae]|uniref:Manganese/zinc/iron transport system substrate-binding protein n=1 Tax=Facklamia miroungae TaxID=120956 RepID=A0A1G7PDD6_9LACT|nr:zinc ABC transporter substrate-binding protein [Facklamia miroungae]NKZ28672.1 zinc ABC transporter solute-binding protein [Facklamia miroungae]SDF84303.1 manganese/zinc/iron transport system substrate-binding protein [Facklamia miroungae]
MRKVIKVLFTMILMIGSLAGTVSPIFAEDKPAVTVSSSFLYDMVDNLAGDFVTIEMIIPTGEDPHLYEARPQDLQKIKAADLVLYHGLHFEGKMADILEPIGIAVTENFDPSEVGVMDNDSGMAVDPHFWFDIHLYQEATIRASEALIELVPDHKDEILQNLEDYRLKLEDLDKEVKEKIASIPEDSRYLITPHDAFNYFSRAYGIPVRAPQGVTTDSEVSNKDIDDTVDFIVEKQIKAIFAESTTDPARMEKLKEACAAKGFEVEVIRGEGQELFSDSLAPEGQEGDKYIEMVRHNVDLIVDNLK